MAAPRPAREHGVYSGDVSEHHPGEAGTHSHVRLETEI
jgi:hypothetical protein